MKERQHMTTLTEDTIVREFLLRDRANSEREAVGQPIIPIMPSDLAHSIGVNDATVRGILRKRGLWEQRHRDAAKRETLRRINVGKARNGYPSLDRQRQAGFTNLTKARERLAELRQQQKTQAEAQPESAHA